jgi:hypothetical protein
MICDFQVRIENSSKKLPILLNDEEVTEKKFLKSGDVIQILDKKMLWETKADEKRK